MKSFLQYITERRKTPLTGQAQEEWDEVKGAMRAGLIPTGYTRKQFARSLASAPVTPHAKVDWPKVSNTDAQAAPLPISAASELYAKYKQGKRLDPSVLSSDPSIIAVHGSPERSTLLAGNTRAMLGGNVKTIRVGGQAYRPAVNGSESS